MADREEFIRGLRELADFLEQRPDLPDPQWTTVDMWTFDKEEFAAKARLMGTSEKVSYAGTFVLRRHFGNIRVDLNISQEKVCQKVVTGKEWVEPYTRDGHYEEQVEWVCDDPIFQP